MKQTSLILSILLLLFTACKEENELEPKPDEKPDIAYDSSYLFNLETLTEVKLEIKLRDWNNLLSYFDTNPHNEENIPARFTFRKNGESHSLDSIGIRIRGNTSRRRPEGSFGQPHNPTNPDWHHAHFALKFGEYRKGQQFMQTDRFNLKWFKDDAAYCRELYCYDLFRRFGVWSAPRATYTRLTIHVEGDTKPAYFGVYALIEAVNDSYLSERKAAGHWKSSEGNLWKGSYGADLNDLSDWKIGVEDITLDPSTMKTYAYDLKTNKKKGFDAAKSQLKEFSYALKNKSGDELKRWFDNNVEVDQLLRAYAVNVMVGMWDDYWANTNNYYLYFDSNGRLTFIPYDYDNTLGTSGIMANAGTQPPLQWGPTQGRPLLNQLLAIPAYRNQYLAYLRELADPKLDLFHRSRSIPRIQKWHQMIAPYVSNDTGEDMTLMDRPASWGNCPFYRIFEGNELGGSNGNANFFDTKVRSVTQL